MSPLKTCKFILYSDIWTCFEELIIFPTHFFSISLQHFPHVIMWQRLPCWTVGQKMQSHLPIFPQPNEWTTQNFFSRRENSQVNDGWLSACLQNTTTNHFSHNALNGEWGKTFRLVLSGSGLVSHVSSAQTKIKKKLI